MNLEKEMRDKIDYKIDGIHPKDAIEVALKYGEFIKNKAIGDAIKIVRKSPYADRIDYEVEVYRDVLVEKLIRLKEK